MKLDYNKNILSATTTITTTAAAANQFEYRHLNRGPC